MAEIKLPNVKEGGTLEEKYSNLYDAYSMLRKELTFLLLNLDDENVMVAKKAIIADLLAGTIRADQIDVEFGKLQTAQIEDLTVGNNVTMGAGATISWANVTEQPSIPTLPSYIKSTYIDQTNIASPTITGGTIQTAASGQRMVMDPNGITTYNSSGAQSGVTVKKGDGSIQDSAVRFYHSNILVGSFYYDGSGNLYIGAANGAWIKANGTWDFSGATVTGLATTAVFG